MIKWNLVWADLKGNMILMLGAVIFVAAVIAATWIGGKAILHQDIPRAWIVRLAAVFVVSVLIIGSQVVHVTVKYSSGPGSRAP